MNGLQKAYKIWMLDPSDKDMTKAVASAMTFTDVVDTLKELEELKSFKEYYVNFAKAHSCDSITDMAVQLSKLREDKKQLKIILDGTSDVLSELFLSTRHTNGVLTESILNKATRELKKLADLKEGK